MVMGRFWVERNAGAIRYGVILWSFLVIAAACASRMPR